MIRRYPQLRQEYEALHAATLTAAYTGMPRAAGDGRSLEAVALRELPSVRQNEYDAVRRAVELTEKYPNGQARLKVIRLVFWDRGHTLEGAALKVPCSPSCAKEWHGDFIRLVASNFKCDGLIDQ